MRAQGLGPSKGFRAEVDSVEKLKTERLVLRPFSAGDAQAVVRLAGVREIADTTENVPHPYDLQAAQEWIGGHAAGWEERRLACWAITAKDSQALMGAFSVRLARYQIGDIGYWLGKDYWGRGYVTEAGLAVVAYAREQLGLHRLQARHLVRNPASGRVLQKLGFSVEGRHPGAVVKWGKREDMVSLGLILS